MRVAPVNFTGTTLRYIDHEARLDESGQPMLRNDGKPKVGVDVLVEAQGRRPEVVRITVAGPVPPLQPMEPVVFLNPVCGAYNGNLWFTADAVKGAKA